MLKNLSIKNIVLIDEADIDFDDGLCVLTGETGSGKSILLDALSLAIGTRSSSRLLRNGEKQGIVTASFDISKNQNCKFYMFCSYICFSSIWTIYRKNIDLI